ncbi:MAG: ABC transporter permease [Clostridiales bacterium]|nr:ABC transporter permease [Clostridiales bacterium]
MFKHIFMNKLKILLRNKSLLFWTLIFPFILGTFFHLALGNVGEDFEFKVIPIAVVDNDKYKENKVFNELILNLSKENENQLFETKYVDENNAKELLDKDEIDAYIMIEENNNPIMIVKQNGINQTIVKSVLDEYYQMSSTVENIINNNPQALYNGIIESLYKEKNVIVDDSKEKIDFSINYFFTLIAMTCLYGSLIGLEIIKDCESNLSKKAARTCMSPVSKFKIVIAGLLAGYIIQIVTIALLFLYLIYILNVNFGNQVLLTAFLSLVGCLCGTALGTFIGVSNKKSENFKTGILISIIMSCCFFSGMMGMVSIKVFFDEKFPVFAKINPINIITDGLYSLFAYDNLDIYYNCVIRISIFSFVLIALSCIFIRRKKYDSI